MSDDKFKDWCNDFKDYLISVFVVATIVFAVIMIFPYVVFAEVLGGGTSPDLGGFWVAIGTSHWPLAVGIGLTILVWAMRSFVIHKIPKNALPWVTFGLAVIGTSGTRMVQAIGDDVVWWQGLIQGVLEGATVGFAAIGWWDMKQTVKRRQLE
jgi:hypothetical protein